MRYLQDMQMTSMDFCCSHLGKCSLKMRSLYCSKSANFSFSSVLGSLMTSGALHSMVKLSGHPLHYTPRPHHTGMHEQTYAYTDCSCCVVDGKEVELIIGGAREGVGLLTHSMVNPRAQFCRRPLP